MDQCEHQFLLTLFSEQSQDMRFRSQAEHIYTGAAVGSFGATAWGIATLPHREPALLAVVGIAVVGAFVIAKIHREHLKYKSIKSDRTKVMEALGGVGKSKDHLYPEMTKPAGQGYLGSVWLVVAAAIGAILFCLAAAFPVTVSQCLSKMFAGLAAASVMPMYG